MACYFGVGLDEYQAWEQVTCGSTIFLIVVVGEKVNPMAITASSLYKAFLQGTRKSRLGGSLFGKPLGCAKVPARSLAVEESIRSIILTALSSEVQVEDVFKEPAHTFGDRR